MTMRRSLILICIIFHENLENKYNLKDLENTFDEGFMWEWKDADLHGQNVEKFEVLRQNINFSALTTLPPLWTVGVHVCNPKFDLFTSFFQKENPVKVALMRLIYL